MYCIATKADSVRMDELVEYFKQKKIYYDCRFIIDKAMLEETFKSNPVIKNYSLSQLGKRRLHDLPIIWLFCEKSDETPDSLLEKHGFKST
ncbi:hypothetical protein JXA85_07365 [Candidatus Woesearchaeota archaeon]|nr:hypothetical protein [Candidatus Woesearchaeota archaeon]